MKKILWCITGAGYKLKEVFEAIRALKEELGLKVTTALSRAGWEIVRLYGLEEALKAISPGGYYEEIFIDDPLRPVSKVPGRVMRGSYSLLAIAPATGNTVAKMVHGIADTLVTQAFAMAGRSRTPVVVLPSEALEVAEATLPCLVDHDACRACPDCPPLGACPHGAIYRLPDGRASIDLSSCRGCGICAPLCPHGAISCWRRVEIYCRELDIANVGKLKRMPGVQVVLDEEQLYKTLRSLLRR